MAVMPKYPYALLAGNRRTAGGYALYYSVQLGDTVCVIVRDHCSICAHAQSLIETQSEMPVSISSVRAVHL